MELHRKMSFLCNREHSLKVTPPHPHPRRLQFVKLQALVEPRIENLQIAVIIIKASSQPKELMRTPSRNTLHLPRLTQNISKRNASHLCACR